MGCLHGLAKKLRLNYGLTLRERYLTTKSLSEISNKPLHEGDKKLSHEEWRKQE
jgi:hypothetical protein